MDYNDKCLFDEGKNVTTLINHEINGLNRTFDIAVNSRLK
jgi:hypothetical protein